jgi:hypothetical protein
MGNNPLTSEASGSVRPDRSNRGFIMLRVADNNCANW